MTFLQALRYFAREALVSLGRSWKVSTLAILTIAVSLFVGGVFWLVGENLSRTLDQAQQESEVVAYFELETPAARVEAVAEAIRGSRPGIDRVAVVTEEEARRRFADLFPSLAELVEGPEAERLPASLEIDIDRSLLEGDGLDLWLEELRRTPELAMVDDDREWLRQLSTLVTLARGLGLALGGVLLGAAIFTIASVIRLTAYLYQEEIAIMRLVGATEFFIRGPFYVEGLLQGLAGGALSALGLGLAWTSLASRAPDSLFTSALLGSGPGWQPFAALVLLGGVTGLSGAIISLRREDLGEPPNDEASG